MLWRRSKLKNTINKTSKSVLIYYIKQTNLVSGRTSVQRSYTKRLPGFSRFTYEERLCKLHLPSLEHRRLVTDLVTCFKIVHGLTSLKFDDFFKFSPNRENSRGHQLRLVIPLSKTNTHKFFFSSRVVIPWNSLPVEVVTSVSAASFKKKLLKINLNKYLNFPCVL